MMGIPQIVDVPSDKPNFLSNKASVKQWPACREYELAQRPGELTIVVCSLPSNHGRRTGTFMPGSRVNLPCVSTGSQSVDAYFKISPSAFQIAKQGTFPPISISFEDFKYEWQVAPMDVENHIRCVAN